MTECKIDREVYESELLPWLPPKIIDCHVHVKLDEHCRPLSPERIKRDWAMEIDKKQSWRQLKEHYKFLFPKQEVTALAFGTVIQEGRTEQCNEYILKGASDPNNKSYALFVTRPEWDPAVIAEAMFRGFKGIKPYPDFAPQGTLEVSIYDFLPRKHLKALDDSGGILMLHLPRAGRLGDPDNIREALEIHESYPSIKFIIAHIGRAYCMPFAEHGLPHFADAKGIYFDTSAHLNADVFRYALEIIGPDRLLFGSDLPITLMRGVREHVGEQYINYTDEPYSWNVNRKSPEEEARYTYFLYEELKALIKAVQGAGLGKDSFEKILYSNSARLLGASA